MKYIKLFEDDDNMELSLMKYIEKGRLFNDDIKDLIRKGVNVNCQNFSHGYTPLIWAADKGNIIAMIDLINAGADWNIKGYYGKDFFDYIGNIHKHIIMERFPEKYQEYIMRKEAENYNL